MSVSRETLVTSYFSERAAQTERYAELLGTWGIERGLIGPRETDRIWERHIANCIPVTTLIPEGVTVADIGSGAGLPGIVIALARPDLRVTLIEPLQRRVDFLNEVIKELDLPVTVIRGKAESVKSAFAIVTARAVKPLPVLLPMVWPLIASKGALLAIKGESAQAEIDETKPKTNTTTTLHTLNVGELEMARIIEVRKSV
jgi:16S rRNA (guanine527-N7)-methyltransferase